MVPRRQQNASGGVAVQPAGANQLYDSALRRLGQFLDAQVRYPGMLLQERLQIVLEVRDRKTKTHSRASVANLYENELSLMQFDPSQCQFLPPSELAAGPRGPNTFPFVN
jgi:hypothetical protein